MSPLFGHHDDDNEQAQNVAALQAEVQRLDSLSLEQLASEVMRKGFGPGGPGADEQDTEMNGLDYALTRKGRDPLARDEVERLLG